MFSGGQNDKFAVSKLLQDSNNQKTTDFFFWISHIFGNISHEILKTWEVFPDRTKKYSVFFESSGSQMYLKSIYFFILFP